MKLRNIILTSIASVSLFSCQKLLDIKETDLIAGDVALKTVENCEQATIGAYAQLGTQMTIQLNFTLSDEVKKGEFYNAGTTHEWQYNNADVGIRDNFTAITPNYSIINRANGVLQALPKSDSTRVGDITLRSRLRGECLFLRAYAHFELFRYYCANYDPNGLAMPYNTATTLDPQARIKMGAYFQQLNADLVAAKALVPNNLLDLNRANVLSVAALQARVALYMRDWTNAATFATEFINTKPLATRVLFPGIWTDGNTEELSFRIIRTTAHARMGSLFQGTSANSSNIAQVVWLPSDALWNSFDQTNDIRFSSYFRTEPLLAAQSRPSRLVSKYRGSAGYGAATENIVNEKVFRTAEMVLIRAEARAEQGIFTGANSAESDINLLRSNRINGYTNVTFASKNAAIDAIMLERFKELAYEGHRFWDLERRGLPVTRLASDAPTTAATTLPAGNFRFLLPIPLTEMNANPLMIQNPGY
jgi:hypothetical protein